MIGNETQNFLQGGGWLMAVMFIIAVVEGVITCAAWEVMKAVMTKKR